VKQTAGITNRPSTQVQRQDELTPGTDRCPHLHSLGIVLDPGHQLVQLQVAHLNSLKEQPFMQPGAMVSATFQPAVDSGRVMVEDTGMRLRCPALR